ncbi:MAG: FAD-dependent oxidoreductase [Cytophagaceae bacterium]
MENNSLWQAKGTKGKNYHSLNGEKKCDVVVIGGGITGLTTAYRLSESGKEVVVLEASKIGSGTTGQSSCHLTTDIDTKYKTLYEDFDTEVMQMVAESRLEGIQYMEDVIRKENIECEFKRVPGYYYTEIPEDIQNIEEEFQHLQKTKLNVSLQDHAPLPFETYKAIKFENQAQFNAQSYLNGLAEAIDKKNGTIYENSRVIHIEEKDDYFIVSTDKGQVKATKIVLATHLPIFFNVLQTVAAPYRSYMVVGKLKKKHPEGLFWDTAEPYYYTRYYSHDGDNYVVIGGKDHKTGSEEDSTKRYDALEKYLREHFDVKSIEYKWSSQYYEPADGLPYIGKSPFSRKAFVATGFSGDGLVYGTIAAIILSDLINGKEHPWLYAYDAIRFTPAASAYDFIRENADAAKHFIVDRIASDGDELNNLGEGEGKILEIDGEKMAVCKDESGNLNAVSPVCTHLKCFVQWNNAETSWDCPCHGSRFTPKGEVLCGPAVKGLEKKKLPDAKVKSRANNKK